MREHKKKETLNLFVDWLNDIQKEISKIGRKIENVFVDELESRNLETSDLLNNINELHSIINNLKEYSADLIQRYEEN